MMKQRLAKLIPSMLKKCYKFDYRLGLFSLLFIFFGASQTIAQSFTDNFESEMTDATAFSEGGVNFTTNGSIDIGFFENAGFGGAAGPPPNDSKFLEAFDATGDVGEIMISTANRVFQLEMMAIWLSTIPSGDQSQAGTITFNGTPAAGGAVIPVTFNINPPNTNSWEVVDFTGTALGGVNLSKVAVTLGPGVQYMAIDNFKFTHLDASVVSLTIDNVSNVENNSGTQNFVFTVTRSNNSSSFSVDVASADGTASSLTDYNALAPTTLNFTSGGPLTQTVNVPVLGDVDPESDETFFVNLTNATNAVEIIKAQGIGTILDDDLNCETFEDETDDVAAFTQNGTSFITTDQLVVGFFEPGGAGSGQSDFYLESDYDNDPHSGSVGQIQLNTPGKVFQILGVDLWLSTDGDPDTAEDGSVDLIGTLASGGTVTTTLTTTGSSGSWVQGLSFSGTPLEGALLSAIEVVLPAGVHYIAIDNFKFATFDQAAVLVSIDDVCLNEGNNGNTIFTFNVSRSDVTTAFDVTVGSSPGTATPGTDYLPLAPVTLNFAANGPSSQTVEVQVIGDLMSEIPETFFMNLSNPTNGVVISDGQGEGIIKDDDTICETFEDEATAGLTMFSEPDIAFSSTGSLVTGFFDPGGGGAGGSDYYLEAPGNMNSGSVGNINVTTPNTAINLLRLDLWLSNDIDPDTQEPGTVRLVATLADNSTLMTELATTGSNWNENVLLSDFTGSDVVSFEVILLDTTNYVALDNICFEVIELIPPICPTVGAVSASETDICSDDFLNLTATGLIDMDLATNMEQDFGIEFVAFTNTPADPYSGGTSLGTIPFGSLTGGNTTAALVGVSLPSSGSYEIYAILSPAPTDATCRPAAMTTITVNAPPTATLTIPAGEDEYCEGDMPAVISLAGTPNGGVYSGPGVNNIGDGINFIFTPVTAGVGTHIITYTFTDANGCTGTATDNIVVHALPTVTFTAPADLCLDAGVQTGLGGGSPTLGVYSGPGVTDDENGMTYTFDPAAAGVGTHTITYDFSDGNGCTNSASDDVEVFALPTVTFTALVDLCLNAGVQSGLGGGSPTGGVYSGPGVTDDGNGITYAFDPAAAGVGIHTITYTFGSSGCNGSATDDIEVFAQPTVNLATALGYCLDANIATAPITGGSPSGGVYSGPGVTDLGNGTSYNFDPMVAGVGTHIIEYTVTDANGCVNTAMSNLEVFDCDFSIEDPCDCLDNASVIDLDAGTGGEDGQFSEVVSISAATGTGLPAGLTWTITAQTGALDAFNIPAIGTQSAGVPIATDGSTILNFNAGIYEIPFVHVDQIGYSISIEGPFPLGSAANVTLSISNKCAYPNPVFDPVLNNLDLCIMDPAVTLGASESSGTVPDGVTFTIDGNPATVFDPMVVGGGDHTVVMTYDGGADGNGGISPDGGTTAAFPGCTQTVQRVVNVNPICCMLDITCPTGPVALQSIQDVPSIGTTPEILSAFTAQGGLVNASCNPVVLTASDTDDGGDGCMGDERTITRTFTVTDPGTGESTDCPINYVIVDQTSPMVTCAEFSMTFTGCPDPIFQNTPNGSWVPVPASGSFLTAVGGSFIQTVDLNGCVMDNYSNLGDLEWTLVSSFEENRVPGCSVDILNEIGIRDACENVAMTTIIIRSTIQFGGPAPVITCPANLTVECGNPTDPATTGMATATSDCGSPTISFADVSVPGCGMTEVITRTWSATDGCGTVSNCEQTITVVDTTPPTITCAAQTTPIECPGAPVWVNPIATDVCDAAPVITFTDVTTPGCGNTSSVTRTWTATDDCGNTATCSATIDVVDTTPPIITCPADVTIECDDNTQPGAFTVGNTSASNSTSIMVPQNNPAGVNSTATISGIPVGAILTNIEITTAITHTYVGDLIIQLTAPTGESILLLDRPGVPDSFFGDSSNADMDGAITFTDAATAIAEDMGSTLLFNIEVVCLDDGICNYQPENSFASLINDLMANNSDPNGSWTINISDNAVGDLGSLDSWNIAITYLEVDPNGTGVAASIDNCSAFDDIAITFSDVSNQGNTGCTRYQYTITRTWTATDPCGNSSTCDQIITVEDTTPPMITCPADLTIECDQDTAPVNTGMATGTDNCSTEAEVVITFNDLSNQSTTGCEQYMYTITRTWTATDPCGNSSTCEQIITVEDTTPPMITCPADLTIECDQDTAPANTGMATGTDNCSTEEEVVITFNDLSNQTTTGCEQYMYTITRTWTATDPCGNSSTCNQIITVEDTTPPMITCPADQALVCNTDPLPVASTITDFIAISGTASDNCAAINELMVSFADSPPSQAQLNFCSADPADRTLIRTYTVTDACGNSSTCAQDFVYDQSIIDPVITAVPADQTVDCAVNAFPQVHLFSVDTDCDLGQTVTVSEAISSGTPGCSGSTIQYTYTATDVCGRSVSHTQTYTLSNEGPAFVCPADICIIECPADTDMLQAQFDDYAELATVITSCSETSVSIGNNFNPNGFINQDCMNPTVAVPGAVAYQIVAFTATDACGRNATCTAMVVITDDDGPVVTGNVSFGLADCNDADLQQAYTNWATNQLNGLSATDACSNGPVNFSYTPLTPNVDCSSGLASTEVRFIASDACGNETILTAFYRLIDNGTEPATATVSGNLFTEEDEMIALANVEAEGLSDQQMMTNEDGYYHFDLAMAQNYSITPSRNDDPLNGITTFDLILLGQHLLEINTLDSPYKMIAADVNESGHISSLDMIELRRLILHIDEQFNSGKSWTFVDAGYVFPQPTNPFATTFPTVYNINNLTNSEIVDFVGVKLGDLNATANANFSQIGDTRSFDGSMDIKLEDQELKAGQAYELDFKASDFKDVAGFQFTLNFAADYLLLMDYQGSELTNMSANNFGFTKANEGKITVSWNENKSVNLTDDATIFKIKFAVLKEIRLSEILSINSSLTPNEAYQADLRKEVKLVFEQSNLDTDRFILFQNQPNPFMQETVIGFQLPEATDATLTIYELSGRAIWTQTKAYEPGIHQVMVTKDQLDNSGVYYYQLSTGKRTATKKMIVLE